jgi:hypothetical protein
MNDVIFCTLMFRGISKEDIMNMDQEDIYLLMLFDTEMQKREAEKMKKMFGGK